MRRVIKSIAVGLAGLAALLLVAITVVHSVWNHERAARTISGWASKTLSGSGPTHQALVIRRVEYPLWPAVRSLLGGAPVRVDAWDFVIWDVDGKEVLGASHVNVGVRLAQLVGAQVWSHLPFSHGDLELHFVDAIVDEAHCQIARDSDGKVNLVGAFKHAPLAVADTRPGKQRDVDLDSGMIITVDGATVRDGRFAMRTSSWRAEIEHFTLALDSLRYSSFRSEHEEHSPAFTYRLARVEAPTGFVATSTERLPLDHVVATEFYSEQPDRRDLHLSIGARCLDASLLAHGRLTDTYSKSAGADLELDVKHAARVLAAVQSKKYVSGDASAKIHVVGPFHALKLEGEARDLTVAFEKLGAHDLSTRFRLFHGTVDLTHLHTIIAAGELDGNATFHFAKKHFRIELSLKKLDASGLGRFLPIEILGVVAGIFSKRNASGELETHVKIRGVDIAFFRSTRAELPERAVLRNDL